VTDEVPDVGTDSQLIPIRRPGARRKSASDEQCRQFEAPVGQLSIDRPPSPSLPSPKRRFTYYSFESSESPPPQGHQGR